MAMGDVAASEISPHVISKAVKLVGKFYPQK
jgi:hypothetical protein